LSVKNTFQHQKQPTIDQVAKQMSSSIAHEDEYETTLEMEYSYHAKVSLEFNKQLFISVDDEDKRSEMKKMQMLIYKLMVPNWTALFMLVCNHQCNF